MSWERAWALTIEVEMMEVLPPGVRVLEGFPLEVEPVEALDVPERLRISNRVIYASYHSLLVFWREKMTGEPP